MTGDARNTSSAWSRGEGSIRAVARVVFQPRAVARVVFQPRAVARVVFQPRAVARVVFQPRAVARGCGPHPCGARESTAYMLSLSGRRSSHPCSKQRSARSASACSVRGVK
jgi:hypothetical protein